MDAKELNAQPMPKDVDESIQREHAVRKEADKAQQDAHTLNDYADKLAKHRRQVLTPQEPTPFIATDIPELSTRKAPAWIAEACHTSGTWGELMQKVVSHKKEE
jgi:hypothetical protein